MLKNTYSPVSIIFKSSAANIISRIVPGLAHIITTVVRKSYFGKNGSEITRKRLVNVLKNFGNFRFQLQFTLILINLN